MGKKKRFGIAIDIALAEKLDLIAKSMNLNRSKLVEKALNEFIEEQSHSSQNHRCCGIIVTETSDCKGMDKAIEQYRDIIISYAHSHIEKRCICMFIIMGDSQRVRDLHKSLILNSYRARYIPIAHA